MTPICERLRSKAHQVSEIAKQMAEAKSLRQEGNTERRTDLYMWPTPEQTDEWKAATLIDQAVEALTRSRAFVELVGHGDNEEFAYEAAKQLVRIDATLASLQGTAKP